MYFERFRALVLILLATFLAGCDSVNPFGPEQTTIEKIAADAAHGDGNKYVNETVKIEATVYEIDPDGDCYVLDLDTHTYNIFFKVETCDDKFKEHETYTLKIYIRNVVSVHYGSTKGYAIEGELK